MESSASLKLEFSGKREPHILRIQIDHKPSAITLDGQPWTKGEAWTFDRSAGRIIVTTRARAVGRYEISRTR